MALYLLDALSDGMFGEPEGTIHRVKLGQNEAREVLSRPFTVSVLRPRLQADIQYLLTLMQEAGFDISKGEVRDGRVSLVTGDEAVVVRIIKAKKYQERLVFSHWRLLKPQEESA